MRPYFTRHSIREQEFVLNHDTPAVKRGLMEGEGVFEGGKYIMSSQRSLGLPLAWSYAWVFLAARVYQHLTSPPSLLNQGRHLSSKQFKSWWKLRSVSHGFSTTMLFCQEKWSYSAQLIGRIKGLDTILIDIACSAPDVLRNETHDLHESSRFCYFRFRLSPGSISGNRSEACGAFVITLMVWHDKSTIEDNFEMFSQEKLGLTTFDVLAREIRVIDQSSWKSQPLFPIGIALSWNDLISCYETFRYFTQLWRRVSRKKIRWKIRWKLSFFSQPSFFLHLWQTLMTFFSLPSFLSEPRRRTLKSPRVLRSLKCQTSQIIITGNDN